MVGDYTKIKTIKISPSSGNGYRVDLLHLITQFGKMGLKAEDVYGGTLRDPTTGTIHKGSFIFYKGEIPKAVENVLDEFRKHGAMVECIDRMLRVGTSSLMVMAPIGTTLNEEIGLQLENELWSACDIGVEGHKYIENEFEILYHGKISEGGEKILENLRKQGFIVENKE